MKSPVMAGAICAIAVGSLGAAPSEDEPEDFGRAVALLAPYTTTQELGVYLNHQLLACGVVGGDRSICTWSLGNRDPSWSALAASVPTDDRINVVCELSEDGSSRAPGSCSIHPRSSNRYEWKPNPGAARKRMKNRFKTESAAQRQTRANAMLDAARTPLEVSRLVGEGPSQCGELESGLHRCTWYTTSRTWGHGTLAMTIQAPIGKKIMMHCVFPADGGPREVESCHVLIGAAP